MKAGQTVPKIQMITAMLIFGSIGLFVKNIPLPSAQIAMIRGMAGSIFLVAVSLIFRKKLSFKAIRRNLFLLSLSGAAIGINWLLLFEAYKYTSVSVATISYYFAPVFVVLLSPFILKERLTKKKLFCIIAAMTGMFLVAGKNISSIDVRELIGIGYGLSAAILYASVVIMNKFLKGLSGLETTLVQIFMAFVVLFLYVMITGGVDIAGLSGNAFIMLAIVGFINTGAAYLLYFSSMQKLDVQTTAIFCYIDPISAILLSAIFLGETMGVLQIIGGILILGAAYISGTA